MSTNALRIGENWSYGPFSRLGSGLRVAIYRRSENVPAVFCRILLVYISGIEGVKLYSVHWYNSSGLFEKFSLQKFCHKTAILLWFGTQRVL